MQKNLSFLLTLFLAACIAALFLSLIVFKIVYSSPARTTALNFFQDGNLINALKEEKPLKLLFFGDIMLDRHVQEKIKANGFNDLFVGWQLPEAWQAPDLQMANLEGAVTADGAHYPPSAGIDFAFRPEDVAQLQNYGFNFFTIANNHIVDQGQAGFSETREILDSLEFGYTGCPDRQVDDCSVKFIEHSGQTIAMLGYSMVYGVLDEEKLLQQIKDAQSQSDLVLVNIHWGVEYEEQARSNIKSLAHQIVDAGADIIIGHHPHVAQNVEVYSPRSRSGEAGNGTPIFYSLGNFIFDQYFSRETQEGLAVGVTWGEDVFEIDLLPFYSEYSKVRLMEGGRKAEWLEWLADNSEVNEEINKQIKQGSIIISK